MNNTMILKMINENKISELKEKEDLKMKEQKIREKIEDMIEDFAEKKRWAYYKILELMIILDDDGNFLSADVTVNYRDENGIDEQLISKFNKMTKKDFNENIRIY